MQAATLLRLSAGFMLTAVAGILPWAQSSD
jgi:hypothetical protein